MDIEKEIMYVKGVGPARAKLLKNLGINTVSDFIFYPPRKYIDRSHITPIKDVKIGSEATIMGKVIDVFSKLTKSRKTIQSILVYDGTGTIIAVWFNQKWIKKFFKKGMNVYLSGKVNYYQNLQIVSPEFELISEEDEKLIQVGRIVPVYSLTKGLNQRWFRKTMNYVLSLIPDIPDYLPLEIREKFGLMPRIEAVREMHFPENIAKFKKARARLAFDEIFLVQIVFALRKEGIKKRAGISFHISGRMLKSFLRSLPFQLTNAQKNALREILNDMKESRPMNRLLQGDVGSGKTIVSLSAGLVSIDNGKKVVYLVPTEILAYQHYFVIKNLLSKMDIPVYLLVGGMKQKERGKILSRLSDDKPSIIIGTHTLLEGDVKPKNIGLIIIDEQHRFGVLQREKIRDKEKNADVIVMTATPIPRTLSLSFYGDLDISFIKEMPPGRKSVLTKWTYQDKSDAVYKFTREKIEKGEQAYIVYPLIEESEKMDLKAAKEMYLKLKNGIFKGIEIGLLYGKMKGKDKDEIMEKFKNGIYKVLVSTTVIEVGIDVPSATIMVIENGDRFGLSQLHQLRGRIGRGEKKSYCVVITSEKITEEAKRRLNAFISTTDGFQLSESDLRIRGPGELLGTQQHGFPDFKFFDFTKDIEILNMAKISAKEIAQNPDEIEKIKELIRKKWKQGLKLVEVA